ncbi:CMRF35-like molecule 1 [Sinocyclocheilus rhinocerous]|uniref:CMRF35-like molecule 1 n=1 Tax=Sinocyclocheilus rhinocerous TaxID=307959 RepID=UPI0007B84B65|nr:PREDICTED: CMRF35-like molecule 1 [Sinocyclocheilus rhinocerous]
MIQICDDKLLIFHLLLLVSVLACETSEILTFTAHERGKIEIQCTYESGYEEQKKYLCRGECPIVIKGKAVESESATQDVRFSLTDNKTARIFTVTITDLRTEDQGKYWCGVKTGFGSYDYKREIYLEIKHVSRVSGVTGEHLKITCRYESELKDNVKIICKASSTSLCEKSAIKVSSEKHTATDERFSLTDNKTARIFTVTITDLRTEDQGKYWCGVKTGFGSYDYKREIYLEIKHEHLKITCRYENELKDNVKFICKASSTSFCEKSAIKVSSEKHSNGRFSLSDNASAGVFTVTIAGLTEEDSGIYWCAAVQRGQEHKNKWISVTDLNITAVTSERMSPKPTTTASFHTSTPATADTASDRTVTSSSSSSSSSPSVLMFFSSTANAVSPKPQTGFAPIIMVVVIGILTGFGFSLFIYLRQIRKAKGQKEEGTQPKDVVHGPNNNLPSRDTGETKEATHTVYDYEDISSSLDHPDYSLILPAFAKHDASVYALAQLPSSPSDILTYSSIKFTAAHHSDRTSDGQETCDYTTVRP